MQVYPTARRLITLAALSITLLAACGQADPYADQRAELRYQAEQTQQQQAIARSAFLEPIFRTVLTGLLLSPLLLIGIGLDSYLQRRKLVRADAQGKLPLPRNVILTDPRPAIAALGAFHATEYQRATPARVMAAPVPSVPALIENSQQSNALPDRVDLLQALRTFTPTPDRLLMGQGASGPVYRSLEQLLHVGVLGSSGSGKSTSQLALACQLAMIDGATMAVLDPEAATFQALRTSPRLYLPFPEDGAACLDNLQALQGELNERRAMLSAAGAWDWQELNRDHNGNMHPIFGFIDELPTLTSYQDTEPLLLDLARRGRKCGMYLVVASQSLKREDVGSTTIRQQFATKLLLRTGEAAQGRALGLEPNWCKQATAFTEPGIAVYAPSDGMPEVIRVPYVGKAAAAHILRGATLTQPDQEPRKALESASSLSSPLAPSPELTEIVQRMAAGGLGQNRIIELVWNLKPGGNDAYRHAREQYKRIVEGAAPGAMGA